MTDAFSTCSVPWHQRLAVAGMASCIAIGLTSGFGATAGERADAHAPAWMTERYPHLVVDQSLDAVLRDFGHNLGIDVEVGDRLKERVSRYRHEAGSREFLDGLASSYSFDWFYDGRQLHVSPKDEGIDKVWSVRPGVEEELTAALENAGAHDPRYPIRFDKNQGTVRLSGPPALMALAMPVVDSFVEPAVARTVNVIHGRARSGGS